MDVMLHKRCAKFIYVIPDGLRELMSDISREVLRSQPEQLYVFIADYLDALMITRENARVAARLVDTIIRIGTTTVELLERTGMTRQEADRMAIIIQTAFRQYMAAKHEPVEYIADDEEMDEEQEIVSQIMHEYGEYYGDHVAAAEIIQKAFRAFKDRETQEKKLLTGMIDWRVAARSAIYLYRKTGVTHEEANRAATLIKAAYKGYYTRRLMKRLMEEGQRLYGDDAEVRFGGDFQAIDDEEITETGWSEFEGTYYGEGEMDYEDESAFVCQTSGDVSDLPDDELTTVAIAQSVVKTLLHDAVPDDSSTENTTRAEEIRTEEGAMSEGVDKKEVPPLDLTEGVGQTDEADLIQTEPLETGEAIQVEAAETVEQTETLPSEQGETLPVETETTPTEQTEAAQVEETVTVPVEQTEPVPEEATETVPVEQTEMAPVETIGESPTDTKETTEVDMTDTTEATETDTPATTDGETTD